MRHLKAWVLAMAAVLTGVLVLGVPAIGGAPETPDDVASACQMEMVMLRDNALDALGAELDAFDAALLALPVEAGGVDAAKLGAASSARLEKIGVKAIAAINKSANRCITRLNRLGADASYTNGTDALRLSYVAVLADSLRFSGHASLASSLVEFMEQ